MIEGRFSEEAIRKLSTNPYVREVRNGRVYLTYDFRVKLYEAWKAEPKLGTVRDILASKGLDKSILGGKFACHICDKFKQYGRPTNGSGLKGQEESGISKEEADRILLGTGKFKKKGNGIWFTEAFIDELSAKYPESSIEDGIRAAGIEPTLVGYQRIYVLEHRIAGTELRAHARQESYIADEVQILKLHPYVKRASEKKVMFRGELYEESRILIENGYTVEAILELYGIPDTILRGSCKNNMLFRIRNAERSLNEMRRLIWGAFPSEQRRIYLQIQSNRLKALENITQKKFSALKEQLLRGRPIMKLRICEWIRDSLPKEKHGKYSLRGILAMIGISKSSYYDILSDSAYGERAIYREMRRQADMAVVQQVADYGGYPKGSRQIYMQMKALTGTHMSRGKIMTLMREIGIQSMVRKANPARRGALKHLKRNVKPNLLKRTFRLHRPGEVCLTDVTYLKYGIGRLAYGSASIDSVTGRVYSFNVSDCNNLELVEETVLNLPTTEDADEVVQRLLHTDQGTLYLTDEFQELVAELGFTQSMSKRGNCWDNAPQESFFGHFKDECPYRKAQTLDELREEIQRYFHYYNEIRGQWSRNKMTPVQFEEYLRNMTDDEFEQWRQAEEVRYNQMKQRAKEKAIERAQTLGV